MSASAYGTDTNEAKPRIEAQEIEVSYPDYANPPMVHPSEDSDWFGAHKYRSEEGLEAGTIKKGIVDYGISAAAEAAEISIDVVVEVGEFLLSSATTVANNEESFKIRWDYTGLPDGGKSLASTFAKFRATPTDADQGIKFDVRTRTEFKVDESLEHNFTWTTGTPSFDSE